MGWKQKGGDAGGTAADGWRCRCHGLEQAGGEQPLVHRVSALWICCSENEQAIMQGIPVTSAPAVDDASAGSCALQPW